MPHIDLLSVSLGKRSYNIAIGEELLETLPAHLARLGLSKQCFILTDSNVAEYHLAPLEALLTKAEISFHTVTVPAGEESKSFATLEKVLDTLLEHKAERSACLIALGGGVIGDLTGFAASILLRGVPFVQVPTTLLSQVDSSVGGKTGINTRQGKNLVGSFYQPRFVLADISLLSTLPDREYLSGYAEVAKYGLIHNPALFTWLEENEKAILERKPEVVRRMVTASCQSKAAIVAEDELESGSRALLNLGHTFGHALEAETGFSSLLLHGEAVALGMVLAFTLSQKLGYLPEEEVSRVVAHLKRMGLSTLLRDIDTDWDAQKLLSHMYSDKKVVGGKLVFILARGIGKAFIAKDVNPEDVLQLLTEQL